MQGEKGAKGQEGPPGEQVSVSTTWNKTARYFCLLSAHPLGTKFEVWTSVKIFPTLIFEGGVEKNPACTLL